MVSHFTGGLTRHFLHKGRRAVTHTGRGFYLDQVLAVRVQLGEQLLRLGTVHDPRVVTRVEHAKLPDAQKVGNDDAILFLSSRG